MENSKTAALKTARQAVSHPVGQRTSWQVYGPYYTDDLSGPSTAVSADSYFKARARRTRWVAHIALALMGYEGDDLYEVDMIADREGGSAGSIVNACLRTLNKEI